MRIIRNGPAVEIQLDAGEPFPVQCPCGEIFPVNGPDESVCEKCGRRIKHADQSWQMTAPATEN